MDLLRHRDCTHFLLEESPNSISTEALARIVGYIYLQVKMAESIPEGYLGCFALLPEYRGQGRGFDLLMPFVESYSKEQGLNAITLHVNTLALGLIRRYEEAGYAKTGQTAYFGSPLKMDMVEMRKALEATV